MNLCFYIYFCVKYCGRIDRELFVSDFMCILLYCSLVNDDSVIIVVGGKIWEVCGLLVIVLFLLCVGKLCIGVVKGEFKVFYLCNCIVECIFNDVVIDVIELCLIDWLVGY